MKKIGDILSSRKLHCGGRIYDNFKHRNLIDKRVLHEISMQLFL